MALGWKFMLPLALGYIVIVASAVLGLEMAGIRQGPAFGLAMFALNVLLVILVFVILDRGRLISPSSARARAEEVVRLRAASARRDRALATEAGD
jgi:hypothetical protein